MDKYQILYLVTTFTLLLTTITVYNQSKKITKISEMFSNYFKILNQRIDDDTDNLDYRIEELSTRVAILEEVKKQSKKKGSK